MVRTPCCDETGLRKGTWTPEEDRKLIAYVTRYGCWNWRLLPKFAGLARCGKSCRLRWMNYLRPDIKRGDYTQEEEETIIRLHQKLGNRWSVIAANLPGRTDNEIKNHWHTALKKRLEHKSDSSDTGSNKNTGYKAKASKSKKNEYQPSILKEGNNNKEMERDLIENNSNNIIVPIMSPEPSSSVTTETTTTEEAARIINHHHHHEENFFVAENDYDLANFLDAYNEPPLSADFWTEPYLTDVSYVPPTAFGDATVPLMDQPADDEYFSPIWDDVELWSHNNTSLYQQECGGLF